MTAASLRAGAVVVAFALDRLFGEPPARLHPVVWMGRALGAIGAPWPRLPPVGQFVCGALAWIAGGGVVVAVAAVVAAGATVAGGVGEIAGVLSAGFSVTIVQAGMTTARPRANISALCSISMITAFK